MLLKVIGVIVGFIIIMDFLGFTLWACSGQIPQGNFYLGTITAHIIGLFV